MHPRILHDHFKGRILMNTSANLIVLLWFLPMVLQILIPLTALCAWTILRIIVNILSSFPLKRPCMDQNGSEP